VDRRTFIGSLAGALLAGPLAAEAQPSPKRARLGILAPTSTRLPQYASFRQALRDLGYQNDVTLSIEERAAEGKAERLSNLAVELVRRDVDVIVASGPEATLRAARQATSTIPIVMIAIDYDPVALGYVASLSRPGGNVTGVFLQQLELTTKRLELLREAVPSIARVAVLWDAFSADQWKVVQTTAPSLGVQVRSIEMRNPPYDFERAFEAASRDGTRAVLVLMSPVFFSERAHMATLAAKNRLAAMFGLREWAESGGLMAYGANISHIFARAAVFVDKILKGAKPADLPVQQPTKFELVINVKTARALGLTIPPSLLLRADEVIQ
jgi:putative tryptophan/tyrosine transport system substrate-binding protein